MRTEIRLRGAAWLPILLLGLAEGTFLCVLGWVPEARATPFPALAAWGFAFFAYAAAVWTQARRPVPEPLLWGLGIGMRLALLPLLPHYSDDIYRFLWDGWVQVNGVNPFLHPPADVALEALRTPWHELINHPEISTIYPPAAQLVFRLLALLGPSVLLFKGTWIACDLGVAWAVSRIAHRHHRAETRRSGPDAEPAPTAPSVALLLYLWSPLVVLEVAWSGHLEPLALLPMMAALLLVGSRRSSMLSGVLLGLGAGVKFAPAAGLPTLLRRGAPAGAALGLLAFAALYLPYLDAGTHLWTGLGAYAARWKFNPGLYRILEAILGVGQGPRLAAGGIVAAVAVFSFWKDWSLTRSLLWILGTLLLLTPTLHPWYVLWILPLAAVRRSRGWLLLSGLVFLSYWHHDSYMATGIWPQPLWLSALVYLPPLALLAYDGIRARRSSSLLAAATRGSSPGIPPQRSR